MAQWTPGSGLRGADNPKISGALQTGDSPTGPALTLPSTPNGEWTFWSGGLGPDPPVQAIHARHDHTVSPLVLLSAWLPWGQSSSSQLIF